MDPALKAKNLASAAARRKRIAEREDAVRKQKEHEMKTLLYGFGYNSDDEDLSSDGEDKSEMDSPVPDSEGASITVGTPSTAGITTPEEMPSPPAIDPMQSFLDLCSKNPNLKISVPPRSSKRSTILINQEYFDIPTPTSAKPQLHPNLTSLSDFAFDHYCPEYELVASPEIRQSSPPLSEADDESPIEIATPIIIQQPRAKPSVISIRSATPSIRSRTSVAQQSVSSPRLTSSLPTTNKRPSIISSERSRSSLLMRPPTPPADSFLPTKSSKRISNISVRSGYPACEATPFEVPEVPPPLPPQAMDIISNAHRVSTQDEVVSLRTKQHNKKPSLIMQRANSLRRSGLKNIKDFVREVKTPTNENLHVQIPSSTSPEPDLGSAPSSATVAQRKSFEPLSPLRPRTAVPNSPSIYNWSNRSVTALPTPPEDVPISGMNKSLTFEVNKKKSSSMLRKRSGSLGKALKSASSSIIPKTHSSNKPMIMISASTTPITPTAPSLPMPEEISMEDSEKLTTLDLYAFPLPPLSPLSPMRFNVSNRSSHTPLSPTTLGGLGYGSQRVLSG